MTSKDAERFGKLVHDQRKKLQLTQESLAHAALSNVDRKGYISQIENGKIPHPTKANIKRIANVLGIEEDDVPETFKWLEQLEDGPTTKEIATATLTKIKLVQSALTTKSANDIDFRAALSERIEAIHRSLDQKMVSLENRLTERIGSATYDLAGLPALASDETSSRTGKMSALREKLSDFELDKIETCAQSVDIARELTGSSPVLSIDPSEFFNYAESPFRDDPRDAFTVFTFSTNHFDRMIIEPALIELRHYFHFLTERGLDGLNSSDFRRLPSHKISPLQRLTKAISKSTSHRLESSKPSGLQAEISLAARFLLLAEEQLIGQRHPRPKLHRIAQQAEVLVEVILLNHQNRPDRPALHVSRSPILRRAESLLRAESDFFRPRNHQLVVDPSVITYQNFFLSEGFDNEQISLLMEMSHRARIWVNRFRRTDLETVSSTRREMEYVAETIRTLRTAIQPIAKEVLEAQISDLHEPLWSETKSEPKEIEAVCGSFSRLVDDILGYLTPLDDAMGAFRS